MNVLMISPGFPAEMPHFTRGLARVGANVIGLGDQPQGALPEVARKSLAAYYQRTDLWQEESTVAFVKQLNQRLRIDKVECLWEPGMILAGHLREALGLPGLTAEQTVPFRDKEIMKQRLDAAGIRTPHHYRATTAEQVREAAKEIGYPIIVKPISGAGSMDTYRCDNDDEMELAVAASRHVTEVSVEEFVEAEEFTYDTICIDGRIVFQNVCWYRPRPLIDKQVEWISPQTIALRDLSAPHLQGGIEMGHQVIKALGFRDGFTHMEWYLRPDGEVVFGEIAARAPGARTVDTMNFSCDADLYVGWAEAVCHGRLSQNLDRKYNAASVFKRANGQGIIRRYEGLEKLKHEFGDYLVCVDLVPIGARRRNWKQVIVGDGYLVVRHPELDKALYMADKVGQELQIYATP